MRIVITGLAATIPLGGVFWDYLQYPLGFHRLGHDVLYVEDTGRWCYDLAVNDYVEDGSQSAATLASHIAQIEPELTNRWFFRDARGQTFGRSWEDVARFCRKADLFINLSAAC